MQLGFVRMFSCAALVAAGGCAERRAPEVIRVPDEIETPALEDRGALCADVADVRVCWDDAPGSGRRAPIVVGRPLPRMSPPAAGFRCYGERAQRRCVDRGRNAGAFVCHGASCTQPRPRLPDDGEWECAEADGIVYCHSLGPAAGVAKADVDPNWMCGQRSSSTPSRERICVDLSPERPLPEGGWACRFDYVKAEGARVCERSSAPRAGTTCAAPSDCPPAMACVDQRCVPRDRPSPSCWFDSHCVAPGVCRYGTCVKAAP